MRLNLVLDQAGLAVRVATSRQTIGNIERGSTVARLAPRLQSVPPSERSGLFEDLVALTSRRARPD